MLPHASKLLSKPTSYFSKLRNNVSSGQSHGPQEDNSKKKATDRTDGPYRNLGDWGPTMRGKDKELYDLELGSLQAVKTKVVAAPFEDYDDDRIHLRVDLEQG